MSTDSSLHEPIHINLDNLVAHIAFRVPFTAWTGFFAPPWLPSWGRREFIYRISPDEITVRLPGFRDLYLGRYGRTPWLHLWSC